MKIHKYSIGLLFIMLAVIPNAIGQQRFITNLQGYNDQPYHFGFILGANQMLFNVKTIDNLSSVQWNSDQLGNDFVAQSASVLAVIPYGDPGFSVGILGNLLLNQYFDLRFIPSLSFGSRSLEYRIKSTDFKYNGNVIADTTFSITKQLNSTYVSFPLLIKYRSWRQNNIGGYFIGGISYSIDLAAAKRTKLSNGNGIIKMRTHDVSVQAGAGFDFYNKYFKLGVEAKMIYGLNNLIVHENDIYSGSINQLHSKIFMLTFTFE